MQFGQWKTVCSAEISIQIYFRDFKALSIKVKKKIHKNLLKKVESNTHRNVVSSTGQFDRT
jgi:hypothetical protein